MRDAFLSERNSGGPSTGGPVSEALACWIAGNKGAFSDSGTLAASEVSPVENSNDNELLRFFSVHPARFKNHSDWRQFDTNKPTNFEESRFL